MATCDAHQGGFTYVWTLMLIASMGVALSIAAESYATSAQREREQELRFVGREFRDAIRSYHEAALQGGKHEYPPSLDALLQDNRFPGVRRHLRRIYVDPMTGEATWGFVMVAGRIAGVHSLSDRTPIKQDNFEPEEASLRNRERYRDWAFTHPANLTLQPDGKSEETGAVQ